MRILSILSILLIMCGCRSGQSKDRTAIAVSFEPQEWLLQQIAGDEFEIVTLLPSGSDPESYQPSISTMQGVGGSDAFFSLGTIGFEKSLTDNIAANFPNLKIIDCTTGIEKIKDTHAHSDSHIQGDESFDPHMLSSIRNCIKIAENMTNSLISLYPDKAEKLRSSAENLLSKLRELDDSVANMNLKDKAFIIRHPSLSYFARDYGMHQISLQENGKETSPLQLKRKLESVTKSKPSVFVLEKEHSSPSDIDIAGQLGIDMINISLNSSEWLDDLMKLSNEINRN